MQRLIGAAPSFFQRIWASPWLRHSMVLLILLVAIVGRTYQLNGQSLRGDEAATVHYSALPIGELWELSRVTDPHPPLYYLILHPWQWLVGETAWAMRYAGVVASILAIAVLYSLSRRTLQPLNLGIFAAALLALNPFQIWLAQDIRSYPFFMLFGLLSAWALWHALSNHQLYKKRFAGSDISRSTSFVLRFMPWLTYIIVSVAAFYIHYYTVFLMAFQGMFVLINLRKFWAQKWNWLASQVVIGLMIIPGLLLAYSFIGQAAGGIDTISTAEILRRSATALLTGFTIDESAGWWLSLLLTPIWLIGLVTLLNQNYTGGTFWGLFFAVPVLGVIALSIDRPFFKERFLVQAQPAFEVLLAAGFLKLWRLGRRANKRSIDTVKHNAPRFTFYALHIASLFLIAVLLYFNLLSFTNYVTNPAYAKAPPWYLYRDYIDEHAKTGDVMLTNFPEAAVSYYSPNDLPFYVVPAARDRPTAFRLNETRQIANAYARIWFLPLLRQGFDEQGDVLKWLDRHADRVHQVFFPAYNINLYLSPATVERRMIRHPVTFGHGLSLRGYQIFDKDGESRLSPGEPIRNGVKEEFLVILQPEQKLTLSLYWHAEVPTDTPYTVFTHLVAADGFNRAGQDNQPVWGSYPTTAWQPGELITDKYTLTIPAGTPVGDHRLRIGWYRSDNGERVPVLNEMGQPIADYAVLSAVVRIKPVGN